MRFTLQLGFARYPDYQQIARTAERPASAPSACPTAFFFPRRTESEYPYADTSMIRGYIEAMPFIEPLVAMSWMGAVTRKIRLDLERTESPPASLAALAKALSSLAALCGERILLGAGLSPWRGGLQLQRCEVREAGQAHGRMHRDPAGRDERQVLRVSQRELRLRPHEDVSCTEPTGANIVGGHSKPALQRAARLGDGWVSANTDLATLKLAAARAWRVARRRRHAERKDFEIHGFDMAAQERRGLSAPRVSSGLRMRVRPGGDLIPRAALPATRRAAPLRRLGHRPHVGRASVARAEPCALRARSR